MGKENKTITFDTYSVCALIDKYYGYNIHSWVNVVTALSGSNERLSRIVNLEPVAVKKLKKIHPEFFNLFEKDKVNFRSNMIIQYGERLKLKI